MVNAATPTISTISTLSDNKTATHLGCSVARPRCRRLAEKKKKRKCVCQFDMYWLLKMYVPRYRGVVVVALTHTKLFRVDFGQNGNVIGQCATVVQRRSVVTGGGGGGESGPVWDSENALQTAQNLEKKDMVQ